MFDWLRKPKTPSAATVSAPAAAAAAATAAPEPAPALASAPSPDLGHAPAPPPPATAAQRALAGREFTAAARALSGNDKARAEQHLRQALAAQHDHVDALTNLGALLKDTQRTEEAERLFQRALAANPRAGTAAYNLALLLVDRRQWADAAALLRTAAARLPKDADVACWLGHALMGQGDAAAARRAYQSALRLDARHASARWGLAMAQLPAIAGTAQEQTQAVQAFAQDITKLKAWFRSQPGANGAAIVGAQQPYYLAYIEAEHQPVLRDYGTLCASLMEPWARRVGVPAVSARSSGRHKIGIVSSHVQMHSVWNALLRGWVEHLDPARFEIHLFHTGSGQDAETTWAQRRVPHFHRALGDWTAWAKRLSDLQLDCILYPEVGMHAMTTRLAALRLARLQLAAWGHPITTGLPTLDGYLSAQAFEPDGAQAHYSEELLALPGLGCCYAPYGTAPVAIDVARFGIGPDDRVLLCPGTPFKYGPQHDALWVDIARRCAPCKLVFFAPAGSTMHSQLASRLQAAFTAAGLDGQAHLCVVPWQSQAAFFGWLDRADVVLDTPGFSGFNTVMQAMERGAPVVAWEGRLMRGRFGSGVLRLAGLQAWIASDAAGYVERVERLCADPGLRSQLRRQVAAAAPALYRDVASVKALNRLLDERLAPPSR